VKNVKIAPKLIICAMLSVLIGIAVTAPLMASELEVKPWKTEIQGPTAHFNIDVVYANFTTENADAPFTKSSGPTVNYQVVVNVTNPSDYAAYLYNLFFGAAKTVTETTGQGLLGNRGNWTSGGGFEAKGAWVDGVWYNVSYVNGTYPFFDANGTMTTPPFNYPLSSKGYWMEGVQGYERTVHTDAGTKTYTYLNMNGTWTDVTGRITVDKPQNSATYALYGTLANQNLFFQHTANQNTTVTITNDLNKTAGLPPNTTRITTTYPNGGISTTTVSGRLNDTAGSNYARDSSMKFIDTGEGGFDNLLAPHESRLIVIQGTFEARAYVTTTDNPVTTLESGILNLKTTTYNAVDIDPVVDERTFMNTRSTDNAIQQIKLTHIGNSYIYNTVLSDNQKFQFDKSGAEATIVPRS
jgi:hypothetical protein